MSSTEATNGISRRAVLAGAAAIGGTIAVASALGTGVTTVQAAPSVAGTAGATGANGAGAKLEYIKDAVKQGTKVIIANGKYSIKEVLSGAVPATRICVR